jgi:hypothetical protein
MVLTYISEVLRIDSLIDITVSNIEQDEDSGGFARRIEFYIEDTAVVNRRPVLTVMVYGSDEESLQIQTPTLSF